MPIRRQLDVQAGDGASSRPRAYKPISDQGESVQPERSRAQRAGALSACHSVGLDAGLGVASSWGSKRFFDHRDLEWGLGIQWFFVVDAVAADAGGAVGARGNGVLVDADPAVVAVGAGARGRLKGGGVRVVGGLVEAA